MAVYNRIKEAIIIAIKKAEMSYNSNLNVEDVKNNKNFLEISWFTLSRETNSKEYDASQK